MKKLIFILIIAMALIDMVYSQSITVTAPGGGTPWYRGQSNDITWTQSGSMDTHVKIYLMKGSQYPEDRVLTITNSTPNDGSFPWTVPVLATPGNYLIRVQTVDDAVWDNGTFFPIAMPSVNTQPTTTANQIKGAPNTYRPQGQVLLTDLSIIQIFYDKQDKSLKAKVKNLGGSYNGPLAVSFKVLFPVKYANLNQTFAENSVSFSQGEVKTYKLDFNWPMTCWMTFEVKVDPSNQTTDGNRGNNTFSGNIYTAKGPCIRFAYRYQTALQFKLKGGGTRAGACSDEVFFYAENVDYDPMLRIAYIDFWFVLQNCGSKLASTDVVIEFPDSRFNDGRPRQIKEILLNMKPMESKTISKRITLQIRPGMYIKVKLNPGCREINLAGSTYCRVNIRFGNNFQWYDDK